MLCVQKVHTSGHKQLMRGVHFSILFNSINIDLLGLKPRIHTYVWIFENNYNNSNANWPRMGFFSDSKRLRYIYTHISLIPCTDTHIMTVLKTTVTINVSVRQRLKQVIPSETGERHPSDNNFSGHWGHCVKKIGTKIVSTHFYSRVSCLNYFSFKEKRYTWRLLLNQMHVEAMG